MVAFYDIRFIEPDYIPERMAMTGYNAGKYIYAEADNIYLLKLYITPESLQILEQLPEKKKKALKELGMWPEEEANETTE